MGVEVEEEREQDVDDVGSAEDLPAVEQVFVGQLVSG